MEIETIPEYIAIYHAERAALKAKFLDKDVHLTEMASLLQRQLQVGQLGMRGSPLATWVVGGGR